MGLSASRSVNDRLRRRLAMESDINGLATDVASNIRNESAEENLDSAPLLLSLPEFIPLRLWKYWALGGAALAAVAGLLLAWLFSEEAAAAGSPLGDMIAPLADRFLCGSGAAAWWVAGQCSCLVWWIRSRSRVDYSGRFHTWGWAAAGFFVASGLCLTDAHHLLARLAAWGIGGNASLATAGVTAVWLLPSLVVGLALWGTLGRELSDCVACRVLHGAAGLAALMLVGIELWTTRAASSLQLEFASRVLLSVLQWSQLMTALLRVRHVVHVTADPPTEQPSLWSIGWKHGPQRVMNWLGKRLRRPSPAQPIDVKVENTLGESALSSTSDKRAVRIETANGSTQEVRIDAAEPTAKGPSRRARQAARRS